MSFSPGDVIDGRYTLEVLIDRGSMGEIYKATDMLLQKKVALKFILEKHWDEEDFRRFAEEAKILSMLTHKNIVSVYSFSLARKDLPYIVCEYIEGRPLDKIIAESAPVPLELVRKWIRELCSAVHFAHSRDVIHRDIKSSNILIRKDNTLKLGDFGLARRDDRLTRLTRTGIILGTATHMAPELLCGEQASMRSDVYATGVVFFELLTGTLPFYDRDLGRLVQLQLNQPVPDPREYRPELNEHICACILKALAKKPEERINDCASLWSELAAFPFQDEKRPAGAGILSEKTAATRTVTIGRADRTIIDPDAARSMITPRTSGAVGETVLRASASLCRTNQLPPFRGKEEHPSSSLLRFQKGLPVILTLILIIAAAYIFRPAGPGHSELADIKIDWSTKTHSCRASWRIPSKRSLWFDLLFDGTKIHGGRVEADKGLFSISLKGLSPGKTYHLVIKDGKDRISRKFKTSAIEIQREILACALPGQLFIDYASNSEKMLDISISDEHGNSISRIKHCKAEGPLLISGLPTPPTCKYYCWKLSCRGNEIAGAKTCVSILSFHLPALPEEDAEASRLFTEASKRERRCNSLRAVLSDSMFFISDNRGTVHALKIRRPSYGSKSSPNLEFLWAFRPPLFSSLAINTRADALAVLPGGRLFFVTGRLSKADLPCVAWCLDIEARTRLWASRFNGREAGRLPSWLTDPVNDWNRPLNRKEWRIKYKSLRGFLPHRTAVVQSDFLVAQFYNPAKSVTFASFDHRGTLLSSQRLDLSALFSSCIGKEDEDITYSSVGFSSAPFFRDKTLYSLVYRRRYTQHEQKSSQNAVLSCDVSGRKIQQPKTLICFKSSATSQEASSRTSMADGMWLSPGRTLFFLPFDGKAVLKADVQNCLPERSYAASPFLPFSYNHFYFIVRVRNKNINSVILRSAKNILKKNPCLCSVQKTPDGEWQLRLYSPSLFNEADIKRIEVRKLFRWRDYILGQSIRSIFAIDPSKKICGSWNRNLGDYLTTFSVNKQGYALLSDRMLQISLVPVQLLLAHNKVRIRPSPPSVLKLEPY